MSEIHVISTSSIIVESTARVSLTPWDLQLLFLEYNQKGLLYSKPTPPEEAAVIAKSGATSLMDHLKVSLQRTLHFFPLLAGRLTATTSDGGAATCFFIEGNSDDENRALFVHATVNDVTVSDILNATYVPEIVSSFFPLNGVRNYEGVARPLLGIQVTELVDGLFIGCSINHLLLDGTSYSHFLNSWAEISRGEGTISKSPLLDRDRVNLDMIGSNSISIAAEHIKQLDHDHNRDNLDDHVQSPPLKQRVFLFSKESIAKLKAKANEEIVESEGKISSLQAVIAHVWRSIIRCRFDMSTKTDQETTTFEIPLGARQRLNPPLPEEYFGNAVVPGIVTVEASKMVENGPGWVAWQINRMVASSYQPNKVKEYYMKWIKSPCFLQCKELPNNYLILINSPRFKVYCNDLGWGKPVGTRGGRADNHDGRITMSRGMEEGSMEIEACLFPQTLSALEKDAEFMDFVSSIY